MALAQHHTAALPERFAQRAFEQLLHEDVAHRPAVMGGTRLDLGKTHAACVVIAQRHIADHVAHRQFSDADCLENAQRFIIHAHRAGVRQYAVGKLKDDAVDTVHSHIVRGRNAVGATAHDDNLGLLLLHRYSPLFLLWFESSTA